MDSEVGFTILKKMIIEQNKALLEAISEEYGLSERILKDTYIKPEYYLPIVQYTSQNNGNTKKKQ